MVIIVNWNGELFLEQCLSALMAQTVKPLEIILLDNASSDKSLEIVRRYPFIRLIALDENTGFARGNNLAIAVASTESEWVVLLNPDTFAEPCWLEKLLETAMRNPTCDVFGSKLVIATTPTMLDGAGDVYHISGLVWRSGHGVVDDVAQEHECEIFSPCAAAAMYRRSALLDVGGFDEDYFCYVEDVDLGFRLRLAGHRCLYVPNSVVHHVGSGTTGSKRSDFAMYHGHRNLVWTFVKDMPGILFWLFLPLHIILNVFSVVWFSIRGHGAVIIRAKWNAILGLPRMWAKRKTIQQNRKASVGAIWRVLDKRLL